MQIVGSIPESFPLMEGFPDTIIPIVSKECSLDCQKAILLSTAENKLIVREYCTHAVVKTDRTFIYKNTVIFNSETEIFLCSVY